MSHLGHKVSVLPTLSMFVQHYYLIQRWGEKYSLVCSKFSVRGLSGSQVCPRSILLQAIINQHFYFCCYALNQGRKYHKHALGLIMWLGSNEWTRQGRLSASRELWLQPMKVVSLAPTCSWILGHQDTKSLRDSERMIQGGEQTRGG